MPEFLDAAVFDLDGVITFTARVHAAAWKQLFDDYLRSRQQRFGEPFHEFDEHGDYQKFVDGKPRYDGVQSFLESRGIHIPSGTPADSPEMETVCGLGNRKNSLFNQKVQELGVEVDSEAVRFVRELREGGVRVGLASSSKNAAPILERAGLLDLFEAIVDGVVSERLGLRGKPQPDIFLKCLDQLIPGGDPRRAMVAEDAISGVEAGRNGSFGLVLGIDRDAQSNALREHGADWVIRSFSGISADAVANWFRSRARGA
jgi:beta-phosphoglucomutase-like phosphatase (HAD superfamily)